MKILKLTYDIDIGKFDGNKIRLFSNFFVKKNEKKCKIIISNKILKLAPTYNVQGRKGKLKIKLLIMDTNLLNLKEMFFNCISLVECYDKEKQ